MAATHLRSSLRLTAAALALASASLAWAQAPPRRGPSSRPRPAAYAKLPLAFEANRGQANARAQFLARGPGYTLFLTAPDAVLSLAPPTGGPAAALRLHLIGARAARARGARRLPGVSNYYLGANPKHWRTGIPNFSQVGYANVYPGVSLRYYGHQGRLESDFVLAPGAHPAEIRLAIRGARRLRLDRRGDLVMATSGGPVTLGRPRIYQMRHGRRQAISGGFRLTAHGHIGFRVSPYDHARRLIIDPTLSYSYTITGAYSTLLGSTVEQAAGRGVSLQVDAGGEAILTGLTGAATFPTASAAQAACPACANGGWEVFVTKLNAAGNGFVFSTFLGGSTGEASVYSALDPSGNIYVAGTTDDTDFPLLHPYSTAAAGNYLAKLDPAGALVYSGYSGGNFTTDAIAADAAGDAFIAGAGQSNSVPLANPVQTGCPDTANAGGCNMAYVKEISYQGNGVYNVPFETLFGGSYQTTANAIAVDASGNIFIAGSTESGDMPTVHAYQLSPCPSAASPGHTCFPGSAFVAGINPNASGGAAILFSTYLAGPPAPATDPGFAVTQSAAYGLALDGQSPPNLYVTGAATAGMATTPATVFEPLEAAGGTSGQNTFVGKFPTGNGGAAAAAPAYLTYLGGNGSLDTGYAIAVDAAGDVWVAGLTNSSDFPILNPPPNLTPCPQGPVRNGCQTGFVSELNPTGSSLLFSTYIGGGNSLSFSPEFASGVASDGGGNVYVGGSTSSPTFPTSGGVQSTCALSSGACLSSSAFAMKLAPQTAPQAPAVGFSTAAGPLAITGLQFPPTFEFVTSSVVLTITNTAASGPDLVITNVAANSPNADFTANGRIGANPCLLSGPASLPPGGSCQITVQWQPGQLGPDGGALEIFDNAANLPTPQFIPLFGNALNGAQASFSPSAVAFGPVIQGQSSGQTLTISNIGNLSLGIGQITLSGPGDFVISQDTCSNQTLGRAVGLSQPSCTVSLVYAPTAAFAVGVGQTATLVIPDNSLTPNAPPNDAVQLTGTPQATVPQIFSQPSAASGGVNFGAVAQGAPSGQQTVTVSSVGSGPLTISGVSIQPGVASGGAVAAPGDFLIAAPDGCTGQTLPADDPFGGCQITVYFVPTQPAGASESAVLVIASNDPASPQWSVPLAGVSGAPLGPPASLPTLVSLNNAVPPQTANVGAVASAASSGGQFVAFTNQTAGGNLPGPGATVSLIGGLYLRNTCNGAAAGCAQSTQFIAYGPASGAYGNGGAACVNQQVTITNGATNPAISANGRFVAFDDDACPLSNASGFQPPQGLVYLRDLAANGGQGATSAVTDASGNALEGQFTMSSDARFFAFLSSSEPGGNGNSEVYLQDTCAANGAAATNCASPSTILASQNNAGVADASNSISPAAVSSDGRFVAFASPAADAAAAPLPAWAANTAYAAGQEILDANGNVEIAATGGISGAAVPTWPAGSGQVITDGTVTWQVSDAQAYLRDTCAGAPSGCQPRTILISSPDQNGTPGIGGASGEPEFLNGAQIGGLAVSAGGRYVAFTSNAGNLPQPAHATVGAFPVEVYLRDTCQSDGVAIAGCGATGAANPGTTTLLSAAAGSTTPGGDATGPQISADGRIIIFQSAAPLLANAPPNALYSYDTCLSNGAPVVSTPACVPGLQGIISTTTAEPQGSPIERPNFALDASGQFATYTGPDLGCTGCSQIWLNGTAVTAPQGVTVPLISITPSALAPAPSQPFSFTIAAANTGTSNAADAQIQDSLPANAAFLSATASQGACTAPAGGSLNCDLGPLAAGASASITITLTAPSAPGASVTDTASVSTGSQTDLAAQQSLSATVTLASPPVITPASLPGGLVSETYSAAITASGGAGTVSVGLASGSSPLPPGLAIAGAAITGRASQTGTYDFSLVATDGAGQQSAPVAFSITVGCPNFSILATYAVAVAGQPTAPPSNLAETQGVPIPAVQFATVSQDLHADLTFFPLAETGALDGVNFNATTDILGGTPLLAGSFPFTITAGGGGCSAPAAAFALSVTPQMTILPTIREDITATDTLGSPNTLLSATILPITEQITVTDALGSPNTLISATILPAITEQITVADALGSPNTLLSATVLPTIAETITAADALAPPPLACAVPPQGIAVKLGGYVRVFGTTQFRQLVTLTNAGTTPIGGPLYFVLDGLTGASVIAPAGTTTCAAPLGSPYLTVAGPLAAGASTQIVVRYSDPTLTGIRYTARLLANGTP